jgi:hypothetical protein
MPPTRNSLILLIRISRHPNRHTFVQYKKGAKYIAFLELRQMNYKVRTQNHKNLGDQ